MTNCSCCGCRGHNRRTCPLLKKRPNVQSFGVSYNMNDLQKKLFLNKNNKIIKK